MILLRSIRLSICKEGIKILKYIGDIKDLDFNSAITLSDKGIHVFNAADEFFNDLCYYYDSSDGKDLILNDRRNDIYQNSTFCQYGCTYKGIDYNLMPANCICKTDLLQEQIKNMTEIKEDIINFKNLRKVFLDNLFSNNFEVMRCYNLVFNPKILVPNIGFYSLLLMFASQIIFLVLYLIKRLKSLKYCK